MKLITFTILALFSLLSHASDNQHLDIAGVWMTGDDNTLVEINISTAPFNGTVISTDNPKGKVGTVILSDLKKDNDKWLAQVFAPKRDKHFDAEIVRKGKTLHIAVDVGFFTKDIEWTLQEIQSK